jgi:2-C-methyl-D-erythritol 4-phosphate cytidylyltransferase
MEMAGQHPLLVECSSANIKITRPDDLALAEFHLGRH